MPILPTKCAPSPGPHRGTSHPDIAEGHGVRDGKAMIATLQWPLITIPDRLVRHAGKLILWALPSYPLLAEVLARL